MIKYIQPSLTGSSCESGESGAGGISMPRGIYPRRYEQYSRRPILERLLEKIEIGGDCWLWTGAQSSAGYGSIGAGTGTKTIPTHVVMYQAEFGPVPDGLEIDHLCRVRRCCNPNHLEAVTHLENVRRGNGGQHWRNKTHCPTGHPYNEENTYVSPRGRRHCRTCERVRNRSRVRRSKR